MPKIIAKIYVLSATLNILPSVWSEFLHIIHENVTAHLHKGAKCQAKCRQIIFISQKRGLCVFLRRPEGSEEREENGQKRRVIEYESERERNMPSGRERGATAVFGVVFLIASMPLQSLSLA